MLPRNLPHKAPGFWGSASRQLNAVLCDFIASRTYIHSIIRLHHFPQKKSPSLFYDILMIQWVYNDISSSLERT
jgi:hypothetical protein